MTTVRKTYCDDFAHSRPDPFHDGKWRLLKDCFEHWVEGGKEPMLDGYFFVVSAAGGESSQKYDSESHFLHGFQ